MWLLSMITYISRKRVTSGNRAMKNDLVRRWRKREKIGRQLVVGLITIFMEQYYCVSSCENRGRLYFRAWNRAQLRGYAIDTVDSFVVEPFREYTFDYYCPFVRRVTARHPGVYASTCSRNIC